MLGDLKERTQGSFQMKRFGCVMTASMKLACLAIAALFGLALASPAEANFSKAKYHGKPGICGSKYGAKTYGKTRYDRAFLHAWNNTCWSCPAGYTRTANPDVKSRNACRKAGKTNHARAKKHKKVTFLGKCPKGQFLHVLNQTCYACPKGYRRTADPNVGGKKACVRKTKAKLAAGKYRGKPPKGLFCVKGQFYDPRKGGECWSCPRGWHRTINPVTNAKACARNLHQIFAADTSGFCKSIVKAVRDGSTGATEIQKKVEKLAEPLTRPIAGIMKKVVPDIRSPKALQKVVRQINAATNRFPALMPELVKMANRVSADPRRLANVILNPDLMCGGNPGKINKALARAGLRPNLDFKRRAGLPDSGETDWAGLLDGLLISEAKAKRRDTNRGFLMVSASATAISPKVLGGTLSFSFVTDFHQNARLYLSAGPVLGTAPGGDVSVGLMIFPYTNINQFHGFNNLGLELGFSDIKKYEDFVAGKKFTCLIDRIDGLGKRFKNCGWPKDMGIAVSFDPPMFKDFFGNVPGIGITKTLLSPGGTKKKFVKSVDVDLSGDHTWRLPVR